MFCSQERTLPEQERFWQLRLWTTLWKLVAMLGFGKNTTLESLKWQKSSQGCAKVLISEKIRKDSWNARVHWAVITNRRRELHLPIPSVCVQKVQMMAKSPSVETGEGKTLRAHDFQKSCWHMQFSQAVTALKLKAGLQEFRRCLFLGSPGWKLAAWTPAREDSAAQAKH